MARGAILPLTKCGRGFQPRFSRRSQGCFGEVGSSRLEAYSAEVNLATKAGSRSHKKVDSSEA